MDSNTQRKENDSAVESLWCAAVIIIWVVCGIFIGVVIGTVVFGLLGLFFLTFGTGNASDLMYLFAGFVVGLVVTIILTTIIIGR